MTIPSAHPAKKRRRYPSDLNQMCVYFGKEERRMASLVMKHDGILSYSALIRQLVKQRYNELTEGKK